MRAFEELLEKPKLLEDLHRRWMHRITAKITQKIRVLLHHHRLYTGAREKITEHHAGRAASGNTALNTAVALVRIHVAVDEPPRRDR